MSERLEKEWQRISSIQQLVEGKAIWMEEQVKELCNHFYNLALEDVRKEVERLTDKMKNAQTPTETHKCYQGGRLLGYEDVLNFLNQLSKYSL